MPTRRAVRYSRSPDTRAGARTGRSRTLSASSAREWRRRWDQQQVHEVRDREARFEAMLDAIEVLVGRRFRALDLGCGTGSTSERILRRFPAARSVAIDYDPVLLRIGRSGLGTLGGRLTWVDADLRTGGWPRRLPVRRFDVAVSTTALHWFSPAQLGELYRRVARLLRPGGWFLNGDRISYPPGARHVRDGARSARRLSRQRNPRPGETWDAWWSAVLDDPRLAAEAELHRRRYPRAHGGTPTLDLDGHLRALRRAGFREIELIWTHWDNRVLAAMR